MACVQSSIMRKGENTACANAWTNKKGAKTSQTAIISAHGWSTWINGAFPSGTYTLTYYCPHGSTILDIGLEKFINGTAVPHELAHYPNLGQDYDLDIYQKKAS